MSVKQRFDCMIRAACMVAILLAAGLSGAGRPAAARGTTRPLTVYIVRHAEKLNNRDDSPLSPRGEQYARRLGVLLENRGITRILTSNLRRAKDTAKPLADRLRAKGRHVVWGTLSSDDPRAIERTIQQIPDRNAVLLVGRSNFVPELVQDLTGHSVQAERNEYYAIYHLVRRKGHAKPFALEPAPVWAPTGHPQGAMMSPGR